MENSQITETLNNLYEYTTVVGEKISIPYNGYFINITCLKYGYMLQINDVYCTHYVLKEVCSNKNQFIVKNPEETEDGYFKNLNDALFWGTIMVKKNKMESNRNIAQIIAFVEQNELEDINRIKFACRLFGIEEQTIYDCWNDFKYNFI